MAAVPEESIRRALGCLLGVAVDDAAGAMLEWESFPVDTKKIEWALGLPGAGPHSCSTGQITDDTVTL